MTLKYSDLSDEERKLLDGYRRMTEEMQEDFFDAIQTSVTDRSLGIEKLKIFADKYNCPQDVKDFLNSQRF